MSHMLTYYLLTLMTYDLVVGDVVGVEMEVFEVDMSVALFSRNGSPVGTRFVTQADHGQLLPTVAICGNGSEVVIDIVWQNRVSDPPVFNVVRVSAVSRRIVFAKSINYHKVN